MASPRRLRDIIREQSAANFVGRQMELAVLLESLGADGPLVTWVHGIAGIGKSTLLAEFQARAEALGATAFALDCRAMEPTAEGFRRALGASLANPTGQRTVLFLDFYEVFSLLDTWLRQTFIPDLDDSVRVVISSRYPPTSAWLLALEWQGLFRAVPLGEMPEADAVTLLARAGIGPNEAERLNRIARGYQLALRWIAAAPQRGLGEKQMEAALRTIFQQVAEVLVEGLTEPATRALVEGASVVYGFTRSLAHAMLPDACPDAYDRLAKLCIVEATPHGLILNDPVRSAVLSNFRASDPHRFQTYRQAAWRQLRREARTANRDQMWEYTSGKIYLLQNSIVREAFFPTRSRQEYVEVAQPGDVRAFSRSWIRTKPQPLAACSIAGGTRRRNPFASCATPLEQ